MSTQLRWIAAAVAALAVGQASAQAYGYPDHVRGDGNGRGYTRVVRCESINSRNSFCRVDTRGRVYLSRQLSQRACVQGRNWNYDARGIWVSGGCRAEFAIVARRDDRHGGGYGDHDGHGWNGHDGDHGYADNDARDRDRDNDRGNDEATYRDANDRRDMNDDPRNDDRRDDQNGDASDGDSGYYEQPQR